VGFCIGSCGGGGNCVGCGGGNGLDALLKGVLGVGWLAGVFLGFDSSFAGCNLIPHNGEMILA
jgi:hypothetical protein